MIDIHVIAAAWDRELTFLATRFGFCEVERWVAGQRYVQISYRNDTTGVAASWDSMDQLASIKISRLADGEKFAITSLVAVRAPEKMPPYRMQLSLTTDAVFGQISRTSELLRVYAADVLQGDFQILPAIKSHISYPWILGFIPGAQLRENMEAGPGSIFVARLEENGYVFGQVIRDDAQVEEDAGLLLLYLYRGIVEDMNRVPTLRKEDILLPPIVTAQLLPTAFRVVARRQLEPADIFPRHCFRDSSGAFHDEHGKILDAPSEPCGTYGAISLGQINNMLVDALGPGN